MTGIQLAQRPSFLACGQVIDHDRPEVAAFVDKACGAIAIDPRSRAVKLYYAVRDEIFYEIFDTDLGDGLSASGTIRARRGFCLHKAVLYVAVCRRAGIPARLLAAPVRNHVTSPAITELVGGDVFLHWYCEIKLDDAWLSVAPIFNRLTCRLYGIAPLEFDGYAPAVNQAYLGARKMTYLAEPRSFDNPTRADLVSLVAHHHPRMVTGTNRVPSDGRGRRPTTSFGNA
jgi:transglutaminase-like putative cysteine protease